jgi:hypothetical protein
MLLLPSSGPEILVRELSPAPFCCSAPVLLPQGRPSLSSPNVSIRLCGPSWTGARLLNTFLTVSLPFPYRFLAMDRYEGPTICSGAGDPSHPTHPTVPVTFLRPLLVLSGVRGWPRIGAEPRSFYLRLAPTGDDVRSGRGRGPTVEGSSLVIEALRVRHSSEGLSPAHSPGPVPLPLLDRRSGFYLRLTGVMAMLHGLRAGFHMRCSFLTSGPA